MVNSIFLITVTVDAPPGRYVTEDVPKHGTMKMSGYEGKHATLHYATRDEEVKIITAVPKVPLHKLKRN
jgi:hypothetical protein